MILFQAKNNFKIQKVKKNNSKTCRDKDCDTSFIPFNSIQKYCSWKCTNKNKKPVKKKEFKPINNKSKKQAIIDSKYTVQRIQFLGKPENKICFIDACNKEANTIEHIKGRGKGFFDEWAEKNNIPKTLDERYWKPCCLFHNLELERDAELSKKYQLSKIHDGKKI